MAKRISEEIVNQIKAMREAGETVSVIAEKLKVSLSTVNRFSKVGGGGVKTGKRKYTRRASVAPVAPAPTVSVCIHDAVCKFKHWPTDEEQEKLGCGVLEICKFASTGVAALLAAAPAVMAHVARELTSRKKTERPEGSSDYSKLTTSPKDIKRAKRLLQVYWDAELLTEDQIAALQMYWDHPYPALSDVNKQQILAILCTVSEKE